MRNKRGWLRILEAFVAIMLIAGALVIIYSRNAENPSRADEIYKLQKTILNEIASDPTLRENVINENEESIKIINNFVKDRVSFPLNFTVRICGLEDICSLGFYKEELYSQEKVISSTLEYYTPKKVRLFMWVEE